MNSRAWSCVKVEVAVLGSPSVAVLNKVSVDVKQHLRRTGREPACPSGKALYW